MTSKDPEAVAGEPGFRVWCYDCGFAILDDRNFVSRGLSPEAQREYISDFGRRSGWTTQDRDGVPSMICPGCSEGNTPPRKKCPKCGNRAISTAYCIGHERCRFFMYREHLHRICERCRYEWAQSTDDNRKGGARSRGDDAGMPIPVAGEADDGQVAVQPAPAATAGERGSGD